MNFHKRENAEMAKTSPNPLIPRVPIVNKFMTFSPKWIERPKVVVNKLLQAKIKIAPKTTRREKFKIKSFIKNHPFFSTYSLCPLFRPLFLLRNSLYV